ncbi:MAG: hypothetical protein M8865_05330, partial [marine benthic group bacterium]|nr:hypothetical protein [Gemmatimonadota bacterium]
MISERRIGRMVVLALCGLAVVVGEVRGQAAEWESAVAAREVTLPEALSLARENAPALEQRMSQLEVA